MFNKSKVVKNNYFNNFYVNSNNNNLVSYVK